MQEGNARKRVWAFSAGIFVFFAVFAAWAFGQATELPKPTYANSLIISIEHNPTDGAEVDSIKSSFHFGLYAWPSLSVTHVAPELDWSSDWSQADAGLGAFKSTVNAYIAAAKAKKFKFHLVVCAGLARSVGVYAAAKTEDVRNAQWYNDNNIGTAEQVASSEAMTKYVFGTFSRYARKLRANLEAKSRAAFAILKKRMDDNPETFIAVSGWGETEMNFRRLDYSTGPQSWFCDYSPFAVLEFRDWITHQGMYDDAAGAYAGEGWSGGGAKYQGASGLAQFNADFGTSFSSWQLKYFDWALTDDWTADLKSIPLSAYLQGGMMPASGTSYIAGGFDPPRTMTPGNAFYDLWNLFRMTMINHLAIDTARWATDEGIASDRWYSHQIPADYLFGTKPSDAVLNSRYYSSASALWTADTAPIASAGATIYDIKFPPDANNPSGWFARTTQNIFPAISSMSSNWGMLEYDPETYPVGLGVAQSSASYILNQYLRAYSYSPHLINFWRWMDSTGEHRIKGMNKETALHDFINQVRDKARSTNLSVVYTPPKVIGLSGSYGLDGARLEVSGKIWAGESWTWADWGNFNRFEVFRGTTAGFTADTAHSIGTTTSLVYVDATADYGGTFYYKWRAVNSSGSKGPASDAVMVTALLSTAPVLSLSRNSLTFGLSQGGTPTSAQSVLVTNVGAAGTTINWTAVSDKAWLQVQPASGTGNGLIQVGILGTGLTPGTYTGHVTVDDPLAADSPQTITVQLAVYASGADANPFGAFDLPADNATVASSIPVSGWALDDIGVGSVTIKRYPVASDPAGSVEADGLISVGQATFVRGARPDVEGSYPTYPLADRAGWGYMLLTNFLPNQGNGVFTLVAVAADTTGHSVRLGEKTINVDNQNATLPFGAIDTPTQGGTASGSVYYNFGWALTPPPASIPTDGSTIWVWVDGAPLGHPSYNNYRADIATLFPGYANSLGAVGVYNLNTTLYTDAVHTIVWSVTDSAGRADGIGSRYFTIQNVSGGSSPASSTSAEDAAATAVDRIGGWAEDRRTPVYIRRGIDFDSAAETLLPDGEGAFRLSVPAVTRIAVYPAAAVSSEREETMTGRGARILNKNAPSAGRYEAYELAMGRLQRLPVGASFDPVDGVLYWQPGPGFLGEYTFVVVDNETKTKKTVKVVITS